MRADPMTACRYLVGACPVGVSFVGESVEHCCGLLECMLSRLSRGQKMGYSVRDLGKSTEKTEVGT